MKAMINHCSSGVYFHVRMTAASLAHLVLQVSLLVLVGQQGRLQIGEFILDLFQGRQLLLQARHGNLQLTLSLGQFLFLRSHYLGNTERGELRAENLFFFSFISQ